MQRPSSTRSSSRSPVLKSAGPKSDGNNGKRPKSDGTGTASELPVLTVTAMTTTRHHHLALTTNHERRMSDVKGVKGLLSVDQDLAERRALLLQRRFSSSDVEQQLGSKGVRDDRKLDLALTETAAGTRANAVGQSQRKKKIDKWEVIGGLKEGQKYEKEPEKYEGFLLKGRKWPMKGWHKRYFVLNKGILSYAKRPHELQKGKSHGNFDVGLSVMSIKKDGWRIDLDTEDSLYHVKAKSNEQFDTWVSKLRSHRLYRQHQISFGDRADLPHLTNMASPAATSSEVNVAAALAAEFRRRSLRREMSQSRSSVTHGNQDRVAAWLNSDNNSNIDKCNKVLSLVQNNMFQLTTLLQELEQLPSPSDSNTTSDSQKSIERQHSLTPTSTPKRGKRSYISFKKTKRKEETESANQLQPPPLRKGLSSSNPDIAAASPPVGPFDESSSAATVAVNDTVSSMTNSLFSSHSTQLQHENKVRQEYLHTSKEVQKGLSGLLQLLVSEREKIHAVLEEMDAKYSQSALKQTLLETQAQNRELRGRLNRIYGEADISRLSPLTSAVTSPFLARQPSDEVHLSRSESYTEYYDAEEYLTAASSSTSSEPEELSDDEDEEEDSDLEEDEQSLCPSSVVEGDDGGSGSGRSISSLSFQTGRRRKLPVPRPATGNVNIWNILKKNIGKDLSKVSMPVTLNEPLSVLQVLCEELEYSELLDKAAQTPDPYERMELVAAFAVSGYCASYYRAGQKPFNPLLGETYECIREDKGFKFIAEQVSHHPPCSACHCTSSNFTFWQDIRLRTKFWGRSMEILPAGSVHLTLPQYNDHYVWNKVTSCVHNILSGQKWVDHYGDKVITNGGITCKLNFVKASYLNSKHLEVHGSVLDAEGQVVSKLFGKWNEGIYSGRGHSSTARCIWRPAQMPQDYDLYYGFTRFAIELNELRPGLLSSLPPTDSRFRPDQRSLEDGNIEGAEKEKLRVESLQRERRKKREEENKVWLPAFFARREVGGKESWVFKQNYWELRKEQGFSKLDLPKLW